ncbi:MAG: ATP-binding protein [Bacteroidia bacterium]|nr:ATP-binding protein [Bacteroidia bacterium]MDW8345923.1 AAA family ATPase [Bacteroidia bacterium]
MKPLPIGINTFESIIEGNFVYVDKTELIYTLVKQYGRYFLSRPRRFGKSLLLDTIQCIFEGKKGLFQGLYIYDKWDWTQTYPVIKIDFLGTFYDNPQKLEVRLQKVLNTQYFYHQIPYIEKINSAIDFETLITSVYQKYQRKVVVLIDEYDKPILDSINQTDIARQHRDMLKGFYSVLKGCDAYLQFVFITGVSKFSKVSVFSDLNNLDDITISPHYATLCGYTHAELLHYFADYLQDVDIQQVQKWYNGYCWDVRKEKVYNPFGILKFLNTKQYKSHWFETGTPSFLIKLIEDKEQNIPDLEHAIADHILLSTFDVENIPIVSALWQTGYLTIKKEIVLYGVTRYELGYPNFEVEQGFTHSLLSIFVELSGSEQDSLTVDMIMALDAGEIEKIKRGLEILFCGVSYTYSAHIKRYEGFYGSMVYCFFKGMGLECISEDVTQLGRIDLTLNMRDKVYLFEFKMAHHHQSALYQIKTREYYQKYLGLGKEVYAIGLIFDHQSKNITTFEWERIA